MIAENAAPILQARRKGMRPAEMVMVSLVGPVKTPNHVVLADVSKDYDWRWARDLDVCVLIGDAIEWFRPLKQIALCRPEYLAIWHPSQNWGAKTYLIPTADDIAKPVKQWGYELDYLAWLDFQNEDFKRAAYP